MGKIFLIEETQALESLKIEVHNCFKCPLGSQCIQKVYGEGPIGADIMSISEAPGKEEDEQGRPYMGRAGAFWEGILASVGWQRHIMYVTNVIKCRPPNNKYNEDLSEADICMPFLRKQISIVQPKMILAFGRLAGYGLGILSKQNFKMKLGPILGIQKVPYEYVGHDKNPRMATVVWCYHPSYLMRGNKEKECAITFEYLFEAKEIYNGMVKEEIGDW